MDPTWSTPHSIEMSSLSRKEPSVESPDDLRWDVPFQRCSHSVFSMWRFPKWGLSINGGPKNGWFLLRENPIVRNGWFGGTMPLFQETNKSWSYNNFNNSWMLYSWNIRKWRGWFGHRDIPILGNLKIVEPGLKGTSWGPHNSNDSLGFIICIYIYTSNYSLWFINQQKELEGHHFVQKMGFGSSTQVHLR